MFLVAVLHVSMFIYIIIMGFLIVYAEVRDKIETHK